MRPSHRSILKGHPAFLDTEGDPLSSGSIQARETAIHCPCLGGSAPDGNAPLIARRRDFCPKRMTFDRQSSLMDRTHLSAKAFRLGLRGGSAIRLIPTDSMMR